MRLYQYIKSDRYSAKIREGTGGIPAGFYCRPRGGDRGRQGTRGQGTVLCLLSKGVSGRQRTVPCLLSESLVEIGHFRDLNVYGDACVAGL